MDIGESHPCEVTHLIFEVYRRIEVGNLRVDRFANHFPFAGVKEGAHFWKMSTVILRKR